jgi:hypothetical protein
VINLFFISFADGVTDPYYAKLSSSRQTSLILGASRASEGIIPSIMDSVFNSIEGKLNSYNYAFSNSDSPYGPVYLKAIKEKLKLNNEGNGVFILSVHPWSISIYNGLESENKFLEERLTLGKVSSYNGSPNFSYFYKAYEYGTGNILLRNFEHKLSSYLFEKGLINSGGTIEVKEDGWLENCYFNMDSTEINKRMLIKNKSNYAKDEKDKYVYTYSNLRKEYLEKTIQFLKKHGTVFLVRIPVDKRVLKMEQDYMRNFDALITEISKKNEVEYISSNDLYSYKDGHHLDYKSAIEYSSQLANLIHSK